MELWLPFQQVEGGLFGDARVTGFLQEVAGESQVCMWLQHYQPSFCKDPRMGGGGDHCGEGEGNGRVGQDLHLGSELNRQRNLSNT